jgi:hypothetical protein
VVSLKGINGLFSHVRRRNIVGEDDKPAAVAKWEGCKGLR